MFPPYYTYPFMIVPAFPQIYPRPRVYQRPIEEDDEIVLAWYYLTNEVYYVN